MVSDGFKVGLCNKAPVGMPYSLTCLANNCSIQKPLMVMGERFNKLRSRKLYLHHYTEYMELAEMDAAAASIADLAAEYGKHDDQRPPNTVPSLCSLGFG